LHQALIVAHCYLWESDFYRKERVLLKKILLVFADYNELESTEAFLKKVGFDVVGINNELKLGDQLLAFNPDIVVASGATSQVSSLRVGTKLKENARFYGKVVIIFPEGYRPSPTDLIRMRMDATLEVPVDPIRLLQVLARLSNLDPFVLVEKFRKMSNSRGSGSGGGTIRDPQRISQYEKFLKAHPVDGKTNFNRSTFDKQSIKNRQEELKKDWDPEELAELDLLRQAFAKALFEK
jgi:DNA-binding response OmpR family regulator